jgi:hypothetical protein
METRVAHLYVVCKGGGVEVGHRIFLTPEVNQQGGAEIKISKQAA